jgi:hypothetical protein
MLPCNTFPVPVLGFEEIPPKQHIVSLFIHSAQVLP